MEVHRVKGEIVLFIIKEQCYALRIFHAFPYFIFTFLFDDADSRGGKRLDLQS